MLAYLRAVPPWHVDQAAHDRLTRAIKQRGVDWIQLRGKFDQELYAAGITAATSVAIWENYRAPGSVSPSVEKTGATLPFFYGRWKMGISGSSTRYDREGSTRVVRRDSDTGAVGGTLEISEDGTYVWRHNSKAPAIRGRWRVATTQELGTEPGQGIVLLNGYDGANWRVTRFPAFDKPGDHIRAIHMAQPYRSFLGNR